MNFNKTALCLLALLSNAATFCCQEPNTLGARKNWEVATANLSQQQRINLNRNIVAYNQTHQTNHPKFPLLLQAPAQQSVPFARHNPAAQTATQDRYTGPMWTVVNRIVPVIATQKRLVQNGVVVPHSVTPQYAVVQERVAVPAGHLYRQLSFVAADNNNAQQSNQTPAALHPDLSFLDNNGHLLHPDISFEIEKPLSRHRVLSFCDADGNPLTDDQKRALLAQNK